MHCNARVSVFNKLQWLQWPACSAGQKVEERQAICSAEQEEQEEEEQEQEEQEEEQEERQAICSEHWP